MSLVFTAVARSRVGLSALFLLALSLGLMAYWCVSGTLLRFNPLAPTLTLAVMAVAVVVLVDGVCWRLLRQIFNPLQASQPAWFLYHAIIMNSGTGLLILACGLVSLF